MVEFVPVVTVDDTSGRIHIRVDERVDGVHRRYLVDERCQTDSSGAFTVAPYDLDESVFHALREGEGRPMTCLFCVPAETLAT